MDEELSLQDFFTGVANTYEDLHKMDSNWKYGRVMYNTLFLTRPDIALQVAGTDLDPTHLDAHSIDIILYLLIQLNW